MRKLCALVSLLLVVAMVFSLSACAIDGVKTEIESASADAPADMTLPAFAPGVANGLNTYFEAPYTESVTPESGADGAQALPPVEPILLKESLADRNLPTTEWDVTPGDEETFSLAIDCIAYDLYAAGYDVFRAFAVVGEAYVPGVAFTRYDIYDDTDEAMTVYGCGFLQISEAGVDDTPVLTQELVEGGVAVLPYGNYATSMSFIINLGATVESFSLIHNGRYARYDQSGDYAVRVTVRENSRSLWDEEIDLYSYDEERYLFKGDMTYHTTSAEGYYSDEARAYATARNAVEQIIDCQNKNGYANEVQTVVLFSADVIEEYVLGLQQGSINGYLLDELNAIALEENQFLVITKEGVSVQTIVDTDEAAKQRLTIGIINMIGNALLVSGSIFLAVVSCGASTPLLISTIAVITGTSAAVYGVSQMIEAGQDIYYGAKGDITTEAYTPVLDAFRDMIDDDALATKVYHIWGLSSSLLEALTLPAGAALTLSFLAGATVWQTTLLVSRAVAVEVAKIAITGAVALGVSYGATTLVTVLTGSACWGMVAGFGSAVLVSAFVYGGLNKLDARYNFSGLHSKVYIRIQNGLTKEETVGQFSEAKWQKMTTQEKKMMINELSDHVCADLGIEKPRIRYYNNSSDTAGYGYFDDSSYTININEYFFANGDAPGMEVLDTVAHELRHAYQYTHLSVGDDVSRSYIDYISYDPALGNWEAYKYQPCEVDARAYADTWKIILKGLI